MTVKFGASTTSGQLDLITFLRMFEKVQPRVNIEYDTLDIKSLMKNEEADTVIKAHHQPGDVEKSILFELVKLDCP